MERQKGLPFLRPVREAMGLTLADLSSQCGYHADFIRFVETGLRDCSQVSQAKIATSLGCFPADLLHF